MNVELTPHRGINMATGKEVTLPQYQVIADGKRVGFLGWGKGKKICFIERIGPLEQHDIELKVATLLQVLGADELVMQSSMVPDVPPELLEPQTEFEDYDDFD